MTTTTTTTTTPAMESNPKYLTRYGSTTAPEEAYDLLDRSWSRLRFLEEVFAVAHQDGEGFTLKGYSSCGLAAILEDIAIDVYAAHAFYTDSDRTPGKVDSIREGNHE